MWRRWSLASLGKESSETSIVEQQDPQSCPVCTSLNAVDGFSHVGQSVTKFEASRDAGCATCCLILDAAEEYHGGWLDSHRNGGTIRLRKLSGILSVELEPDGDVNGSGKLGRFSIWKHQGRPLSFGHNAL